MSAAETLSAIRDIVEAGEAAGWDIGDNKPVLDRARDAYADLQIVMADTEDAGEDGEPFQTIEEALKIPAGSSHAGPSIGFDHLFGQLTADEMGFCRQFRADAPASSDSFGSFGKAQLRTDPVRLAFFLFTAREIERGTDPALVASAAGALFAKCVSMIRHNFDAQTAGLMIEATRHFVEAAGGDNHVTKGMSFMSVTPGRADD